VTADPDRILSEFVDAWNAGRRPDVDDYLARVAAEHQAEVAARISAFLSIAPTPDYDDAAWDEIRADPLVGSIVDAERGLAARLGALRRRAHMTVHELAVAIAGDLGVEGREDKAARYLERLERERLDPRAVSRRVFAALGRALHVPAGELLAAATHGPRVQPGGAFFRAAPGAQADAEHHLEVLAEAMAAPARSGEAWDDVDELFLGGP
jgi:transcriptional regulator with XRE-family HTH domain